MTTKLPGERRRAVDFEEFSVACRSVGTLPSGWVVRPECMRKRGVKTVYAVRVESRLHKFVAHLEFVDSRKLTEDVVRKGVKTYALDMCKMLGTNNSDSHNKKVAW